MCLICFLRVFFWPLLLQCTLLRQLHEHDVDLSCLPLPLVSAIVAAFLHWYNLGNFNFRRVACGIENRLAQYGCRSRGALQYAGCSFPTARPLHCVIFCGTYRQRVVRREPTTSHFCRFVRANPLGNNREAQGGGGAHSCSQRLLFSSSPFLGRTSCQICMCFAGLFLFPLRKTIMPHGCCFWTGTLRRDSGCPHDQRHPDNRDQANLQGPRQSRQGAGAEHQAAVRDAGATGELGLYVELHASPKRPGEMQRGKNSSFGPFCMYESETTGVGV